MFCYSHNILFLATVTINIRLPQYYYIICIYVLADSQATGRQDGYRYQCCLSLIFVIDLQQ